MAQDAKAGVTTQVYEIYIRAPAAAVWDAITSPEWTEKYGYKTRVEYELRPRGAFRHKANAEMCAMGLPEVIIDGEVIECKPPFRLVQTYRFLFTDESKAEGFTRVTWEIEEPKPNFSRLRLTHELEGAPGIAEMVSHPFAEPGGGGWSWILSDMKSLLETGSTMVA
jgi:uncharacterized protein YndB with AHSA1/START domain